MNRIFFLLPSLTLSIYIYNFEKESQIQHIYKLDSIDDTHIEGTNLHFLLNLIQDIVLDQ